MTNLQQDLKYQEEMEEEYNKKHTKLMQDYSKLQEENVYLTNELNKNMIERNNYLSRNEKAVEYINKVFQRNEDGTDNIWILDFYEIANILNGGKDE